MEEDLKSSLNKNSPWESRFEWVTQTKEEGNTLFKEGRYEEAIDIYLRAYCGIAGYAK